jgi:formylglycine-generating enzyme required for sulfatase activity
MSERDPLRISGQLVADKYVIEKLVGEGGFAVVYRAEHVIWRKPVAIKFFNGLSNAPVEQRESLQQAFINEGALLTELSSHTANIVQARDVGTYTTPGGQWMPFMVLEWLEGMSLDELLDRERQTGAAPWTLQQVVRLLGPVAAALDLAHRRGVAHRDIKPGNIFILGEGARSGDATVKLLDFGVAKMMTENTQMKAAMVKTGHHITSFTPLYGAPEQFSRTYGATGPWTDVFALGLVAAEMLSGRPALDGEDTVQLAFSAANPERRPTPRLLGVSIPDAVEAVFRKALSPSPSDRYVTAGEFWATLEATLKSGFDETVLHSVPLGPVAALPMRRTPITTRALITTAAPRRRRGKSLWIALGALLAAGGAVAGVLAARRADTSRSSKPVPIDQPAKVVERRAPAAALSASADAAAGDAKCPTGMVEIPAGQFLQGSDVKDALPNEQPVHHVKLSAFCMDETEVMARAYKACSDQGHCRRAATDVEWPNITDKDRKVYGPLCTADDGDREDHPINCVTWHMASIFCKAQGKRLPTEAEWEYATRGPDGRVYPWGDQAPTPQHLNACGSECVAWGKQRGVELEPLFRGSDRYPTTAPVGSFPAGSSRFGPKDMVGNVWEWVDDWYGDYQAGDVENPRGPGSGQKRVTRGGAWNGSYASWLRPSFRYGMDPAARSHGIGFRCAKSL